MSARTATERYLLRHASNLGGTLTQMGLSRDEEQVVKRLVVDGLFVYEPRIPGKRIGRYVLTDEGRREARQ